MLLLLTTFLPLTCLLVGCRAEGRPQSPPTNGHSMSGASEGLVVSTTAGLLQGSKKILSDGGLSVKSWIGVPYAEAPVGPLRFQLPQKKESWPGVRDALRAPSSCPQASPFSMKGGETNLTSTDEDCLYLSIFAPGISETLLPVMIWIHPGGFNFGSLEDTDPSVLAATNNVIVVSLQYRLGALGFSLLSKNVSNLGLRDQIVAIDFVSHNIINFGGDPTRVTLFGSEAGAVSASYHTDNIHVSSILHSVILQSGGPRNSWAKMSSREMKQRTMKVAEKVGCSTADLACLEKVPVEDILAAQDEVCRLGLVTTNCFVPSVDDEIVFSNKFQQKLNRSNTNVMFGYNSNEGFLKLMHFLTKEFPTEKLYSEGFSQEMFLRMLSRMFPEVGDQVNTYYHQTGNWTRLIFQVISVIDFLYNDIEGPTEASVRFLTLERIVSDYMFTCSNVGFDYGRSYRYLFSWQPSRDEWPVWSGVKQGDEIQFVFGEPLVAPQEYLIEEKQFSKEIMNIWTEFAQNGSFANSSSWPEFNTDQQILELNPIKADSETAVVVTERQRQRCDFWNNLYPELRAAGGKSQCSQGSEVVADLMKEETQSLSKQSRLVVDEPEPRTVRGLHSNHFSQRPQQFVYKVKTKIPKEKTVGSTVKVLERENVRPNKVIKRQAKPENNTQLSYQLSVGLNTGSSPDSAFTVYNTKLSGNSPIYIAPHRYQPQPQPQPQPGQYRPQTVRNVATNFRGEGYQLEAQKASKPPPPELDNNYVDSAYDPFFPGFGAKLAVQKRPTPVVTFTKDNRGDTRAFPYFPNK